MLEIVSSLKFSQLLNAATTEDLITVESDGTVTVRDGAATYLKTITLGTPSVLFAASSINITPISTSHSLNLAVQTAGTVFAAPAAVNGTPSFRALVATDIPSLDASKITTGLLPVARGGSGVGTLTGVLIGSGTSAFTAVAGTSDQILRRNTANTAYEFYTLPAYQPLLVSGTNIKTVGGQTILGSGDITLASLNYWTLSGGDVYRSTGNVGIGISAPTLSLDVRKLSQYSRPSIGGVSADGTRWGYSLNPIDGSGSFDVIRSSNLHFKISRETTLGGGTFTTDVHVSSAGDVGVGNSNPLARTHISGVHTSARGLLTLQTTDTSIAAITFYSGATYAGALYGDNTGALFLQANATNTPIYIRQNTNNGILLDASSNVIINSPSSAGVAYKLQVYGQSYFKGAINNGEIARFVDFSDGYYVSIANTGIFFSRPGAYIRPTENDLHTLNIGYTLGNEKWNGIRLDATSIVLPNQVSWPLLKTNGSGVIQQATGADVAALLGTAAAGNYIQNQLALVQTADFRISGSGTLGGDIILNTANSYIQGNTNATSGNGGYVMFTGEAPIVNAGYGVWLSNNATFDGTNWKQGRGDIPSYLFTVNNHLGWSWRFGAATTVNGSTVVPGEVAKMDGNGRFTFGLTSTTVYGASSYSFLSPSVESYLPNNLELGRTSKEGILRFRRASDGVLAGAVGFSAAGNLIITSYGGGGVVSFSTVGVESGRFDASGYLLLGHTSSLGSWKLQVTGSIYGSTLTGATTMLKTVAGVITRAVDGTDYYSPTTIALANYWTKIVNDLYYTAGNVFTKDLEADGSIVAYKVSGTDNFTVLGVGAASYQQKVYTSTPRLETVGPLADVLTTLFQNGNFRVGSGADSGVAKFQVKGDIQQEAVISAMVKAEATGRFTFAIDGTDYYSPATLVGQFIQNQTAIVQTAGFNINGTGTFGGSVLIQSAGYVQLQINQTDSAAVIHGITSGTNRAFVNVINSGVGHVAGTSAYSFLFEGTEKARLTATGFLGLGITPVSEFHIYAEAPIFSVTAWNAGSGLRINILGQSAGYAHRIQSNGVNIQSTSIFGNVGIGNDHNLAINLIISKNIEGGVTAYGINVTGIIQSGVTTDARIYTSSPNVVTGHTVPNLYHFMAVPTASYTGIVTSQYGFYVSSAFTGATTSNIAFRSLIAAGTGRWNLYMDGTANNYVAGSLGVGSASLAGINVRIGKAITDTSNTGYGLLIDGQIQSGVTSFASYNQISINQASAVATTNVYGFLANQGVVSGTIANLYGFYVNSNMTAGSTLSVGYYGGIPSGTGRWNIYMVGTAANYMLGDTLIGSATPVGTNKLQVTGNIYNSALVGATEAIVKTSTLGVISRASAADLASLLGTAAAGNYIQNQAVGAQASANFYIDGYGRADYFRAGQKGYTGTYTGATQLHGIWTLSNSFLIDTGAGTFGNQYGLAYGHTSNTGGHTLPTGTTKLPITGLAHQILFTHDGNVTSGVSLTNGSTWQLSLAIYGNYAATLYGASSYSFISPTAVSYLPNNLDLGKTGLHGLLRFRRASDGSTTGLGSIGFIGTGVFNITSSEATNGVITFTTVATERGRFTNDGKFLVGTPTAVAGWKVVLDSGSTTGDGLYVKGHISATGNILATGNIIADGFISGTSSDRSYKSEFKNISVIDKIDSLKVNSYYHSLYERRMIGSIAQDIEKLFPELVYQDHKKMYRLYDNGYAAIALQLGIELKSEVDILKDRVKELEQKLEQLSK